jgi:hypothetical protein
MLNRPILLLLHWGQRMVLAQEAARRETYNVREAW